jgi:hypothetical protein
MAKSSSVTEALDRIADELERWKRTEKSGVEAPSSSSVTEALDRIADELEELERKKRAGAEARPVQGTSPRRND